MKFDIVIAGVGGQGVLSISAVIAAAALDQNIQVKQSEVHGMSQRGGAVLSHLRLSSDPIGGDTVSRGCADLILGMEPLESLRYLEYLSPDGRLISAMNPVRNIPDYPPLEDVHRTLQSVPGALLVDADRLAREQGSALAVNMVMVGAASNRIPISPEVLEKTIRAVFLTKGTRVVEINISAFRAGRNWQQ